jgi:site-specific recombinase XerD
MTPSPASGLRHLKLKEIFDARIQTLATPYRSYPAAAHRFLAYLQTDFPEVLQLSELRRDPHLLGWLRGLCEQDPPLSSSTRRIYLVVLRRLLHDLASVGHPLQPGLILPEDFPSQPRRSPPPQLRLALGLFRFGEIFDARIQTLATGLHLRTTRRYRSVARHFLAYLQTDFPQVLQLSELRCDPHLLGWLRSFDQQNPPLSSGSRHKYLLMLRRLLHELASAGHPLQPGLILPEDSPLRLRFPEERSTKDRRFQLSALRFGEIFDVRIQTLATTLGTSTTRHYRRVARHFLSYLQTNFPQLLDLSELRRDPHLFGWFRRLCQQDPPLSNVTRHRYLLELRRLLVDLACAGHLLQPGLILTEDFPPRPEYLPRALSPEDDRQLQQELSRTNDLLSNALLLTRATGIRIGECIHLALDCLRSLGPNQWGLLVPLGKLQTERLVPVDEQVRQMVTRILTLRALAPASHLAHSASFLLPRSRGTDAVYRNLRQALHRVAGRAGCSHPITCHQLRHTFATEMIRLGISLPALMQLLGHKNINMTMRYVKVTQSDLQREFHLARQNTLQAHHIPELPVSSPVSASSDLPGIRHALAATRHLLEMYRRQLPDEKARRNLQRLDKRLSTVVFELDRLATAEK